MKKIHIHFGSDTKFNKLISSADHYFTIGDVLDHINKTKIVLDGITSTDELPMQIDNLVIQTDDYGGIKEWAILSFSNNVLEHSRVKINTVWLNNPPTKFYEDIKKTYSALIEEHTDKHKELTLEILKNISMNYNNTIIGQPNVVRQFLSSVYSLTSPNRKRPVTLLFLGESGVGKTETAKFIDSHFEREMLRIQFSMQQTGEAYKYIFGAEHGEDSLARELIRRESNVILLDEFDKVHNSFYNAFYQMFDEGVFVDKNYTVNVEQCIIICTTNYLTEEEAEKHLGTPIYSRFSKIIKFNSITMEDKIKIAKINYNSLFDELMDEDQVLIKNNKVLAFYIAQIQEGYYKNMRMLKNDIEDALNYEILKARNII
ncbi:AAA family ATPase [Tissierella creatinophila]|uniref:Chaperone protein ClpB n=1 Tax=Tissierella creatinophila DSM 6911 TaxID=1123403 RepID=A0A1U7M2V8_TISCR|nr:AAA family ATPase [Tissierella creatinophila]OLS01616.1 chaperone protein ClpB [Tissierella creatinophila DSM 6911]